MKKVILLFLLPVFAWSQQPIIFSFTDFVEVVKVGHPIARQAELQTELGKLAIVQSKGQADPKVFTELSQKQFDNKRYHNLFDAGLKIPTWFGASFNAGFEQNSGAFLNPEDNTPSEGLLYAGVKMPLGRGLLMDERRATLRQGRIYNKLTQAEQAMMLNDLLLSASRAYWNWFRTYNNFLVFENAMFLTEQRYLATKQSARFGDRPTIDTVEAGIQRQTRQVQLKQAVLEMNNASAMLEVFLWQDGNIPLELENGVIPNYTGNFLIEDYIGISPIDSSLAGHPELKTVQLQLQSLEVDKQIQNQMLLPELNINYNFLTHNNIQNQYDMTLNNYTFGLQFSMPIFLRKERGTLRMTKIKIEQTERSLDQKLAQLTMQVQVAFNEWQTISEQVILQKRTVKDYNQLLEGERDLFDNGESSLFMVNSREMSYIQSQLKLNEFLAMRFQSEIKVYHTLGILNTTL